MLSTLVLLFASLAVFRVGGSTVSPILNEDDVTLLYHNELDIPTAASRLSALLLPGSRTNRNAASACNSLHETLLSTNTNETFSDIVHLLQYQIHLRKFKASQRFWISSSGGHCRVVDAGGSMKSALCSESLPALCSQSAGLNALPTSETQMTIQSKGLTVTGFRDLKTFKFLGIPFADPPARWTYPTAYTGPSNVDATRFGSACVQTGGSGTSEDCLFLNIWTPFLPRSGSTEATSLKPVMIWIHGGAFTSGTGADSTFDGGNMASRGDVVFITINYRLSTLGFLALDDGQTNGNYGIADQIAALDWVREHVQAFGGDANRITIFGQSAGAGSVRALLGSPKAIGKFAAAIPMSNLAGSGYAMTYSLYYTLPQAQEIVAQPILQATNCTGENALQCLKNVDAQTLVNLPSVARFLVVDGTFVSTNGLQLTKRDKVANVHTMMGFMRDDGAAFFTTPTGGDLTTMLESVGLPTTMVGSPLFPVPNGPSQLEDAFNVTARGLTDSYFRCLDQATAFSAIQHDLFKSVWFYEFNRSYQTPGFDPNPPHCDAPVDLTHPHGDPAGEYFKCHSGELFYVFGTLPSNLPYRDEQDLPFMQMTLDIWSSFARTFDPNPDPAFLTARGFTNVASQLAAQGKWLPVTAKNIKTVPLRQLQWGSSMTAFKEGSQCDFFSFSLDYFEEHPAIA